MLGKKAEQVESGKLKVEQVESGKFNDDSKSLRKCLTVNGSSY